MTKNIVVQLNVDCRMCDLCDSLDPPLVTYIGITLNLIMSGELRKFVNAFAAF